MILFQKIIMRADLIANRQLLYVFGDNEQRVGNGGQAGEMRGEPNAVGVATLSFQKDWSDADAERQCQVIDADLAPVIRHLLQGKIAVLPTDGIGTGIAQLELYSPRTMAHVRRRFAQLPRVSVKATGLFHRRRDPAAFTEFVLRGIRV